MKMIDLIKVIEGEDEIDEIDEVPAEDGEVEEHEELPEDEDEDKPASQPQQTPMPQAAEEEPEPTLVEIYYSHLVELAAVHVVLSQAHLALQGLSLHRNTPIELSILDETKNLCPECGVRIAISKSTFIC